MNKATTSIHSLSRTRDGEAPLGMVPRPPARWFLRYVLPLAIVLAAGALLVYVASDALRPTVAVKVQPVVAKEAGTSNSSEQGGSASADERTQEPTIIAQAPGWVEPAPYATAVQPLITGVVKDVLVLEGDTVQRGDVIARLVAEDAELALRRARAELAILEASSERAAADLAGAEAELAELIDEVQRKSLLVEVGGVSSGEFARLQHRQRRQQSAVDAARAAARQAEATVEQQQIAVDEAELALERTVIRAPMDGVVLSRSVVPGTRITTSGNGSGELRSAGIVELYDPSRLQVRADVPLADAAKVEVGTPARVTTEALPDRTFNGEVTHIIHRADIQRNTIKAIMRIDDPSTVLKEDMLTRVRFLSHAGQSGAGGDDESTSGDVVNARSLRVFIPSNAVHERNADRGRVWVMEPSTDGRTYRAVQRDVTLGEVDGELLRVRSGLRPGDRIILDAPPNLTPGIRVTPTEQKTMNGADDASRT